MFPPLAPLSVQRFSDSAAGLDQVRVRQTSLLDRVSDLVPTLDPVCVHQTSFLVEFPICLPRYTVPRFSPSHNSRCRGYGPVLSRRFHLFKPSNCLIPSAKLFSYPDCIPLVIFGSLFPFFDYFLLFYSALFLGRFVVLSFIPARSCRFLCRPILRVVSFVTSRL